ncbi:hypothetical protein K7X08_011626 [Anisodus acutangulus]|uniref:Uncharacterized protein n=1 Tax=Anisodus acutangulus TaxID=402998 RepID=A0A9Q1MJX2_9SOLA|nr:hypothetical protein K7X08_011626 [Anisodus acutangulus]
MADNAAEKKDEMHSSDVDAVMENQSEGQTEHGKAEDTLAEVADVDMKENQAEKKSEVQLEDGKGEVAPSEVAEVDKDVKMADNVEHPKDVKADVPEATKDVQVQEKVEHRDGHQIGAATRSTEGENALMNSEISKKVEEEVTDNGNNADEAANA